MKEFNGQLIGGPDDGNFVTTAQTVIPVVSTTELQLNSGRENTTIIVTRGHYLWDESELCFIWKFEYNEIYTKKLETEAA